jgi:hypothetical protein
VPAEASAGVPVCVCPDASVLVPLGISPPAVAALRRPRRPRRRVPVPVCIAGSVVVAELSCVAADGSVGVVVLEGVPLGVVVPAAPEVVPVPLCVSGDVLVPLCV